MWRVQCTWCFRFKGEDGRPVGRPAPLDLGGSHGICTECAERVKAAVDGAVDYPRVEAGLVRNASERTPPVIGSSQNSFGDDTRLPDTRTYHPGRAEPPRTDAKAWIVVHPGLLELRAEDKGVVRSMIYERASTASRERACALLAEEAAALGFVLVGETGSDARYQQEPEQRGSIVPEPAGDSHARRPRHLIATG